MARKSQAIIRRGSPPILKQDGGITKITVSGYKSILTKQSIDIKPITVLAGANSSGKSSMLQPLLLLKQTLDASYDPGALLLDGPNVRFTATTQFLSKINVAEQVNCFTVAIQFGSSHSLETVFGKEGDQPISIQGMTSIEHGEKLILTPEMSDSQIRKTLADDHKKFVEAIEKLEKYSVACFVRRNRCFLEVAFRRQKQEASSLFVLGPIGQNLDQHIRRIIHLPGLRGNPERTYPVTAVGREFPGTFEKYVASVIAQWQGKEDDSIERLNEDLTALGLTWKVLAKRVNETQVALEVGRIQFETERAGHDLVSIADVGFGVSQVLPVIVALHAARPNQAVFLEQPEIHLHPRAQHAMAKVIARAAKRGVRVVLETHSALIILGLQTLVANGELPSGMIALHWFKRGITGHSEIVSASLDERGAFGEWPEDFADVSLDAESKFLDAADFPKRHGN